MWIRGRGKGQRQKLGVGGQELLCGFEEQQKGWFGSKGARGPVTG